MEDIVAIAVALDSGSTVYFLTWGRIQDPVDCEPLQQLILQQSRKFDLGGTAVSARVCDSLQEVSNQRGFHECFSAISWDLTPFGIKSSARWRREMDRKMRNGEELYFLGKQ